MIRKAAKEDIAAISEIYEHIHDEEEAKKVYIGWIRDVYPTRETAETALGRDDLFVYEQDGRILASAIINQIQVDVYAGGNWLYEAEDDEIMVIHTLTVEPSAGSKGIGSGFIKFYEDLARDSGCRALRLDTNVKNVVARRFYEKLGYREAGIVQGDFNGIPGVRLVLLEKRL